MTNPSKQKNHLLYKIFSAIILGFLLGWATSGVSLFHVPLVEIYDLLGKLFLNALSLVVVPLVATSIITGTARMGSDAASGRLGLITFAYFFATMLLATCTGSIVANLADPGAYATSLLEHLSLSKGNEAFLHAASGTVFQKVSDIFFNIIPSNILLVASQGKILGLIFFSLLFGFSISRIEREESAVILNFFRAFFHTMMRMTVLIMKALPFGVFALVAKFAASGGLKTIPPLFAYFGTVVGALLIYSAVLLPLILWIVGRINPLRHVRAVAPALFTAFSTSSSLAALPITIECMEERANVPNRITSFVIPLGVTMNLSGSALYQCVSVLFIASVYGVSIGWVEQILVIFLSFVSSIGLAGIPAASLISIVMILNTLHVPAEGIGLIIAVERILDMCRTTVCVFGNTCCCALVARSEKALVQP